jgi:hypothetical protein
MTQVSHCLTWHIVPLVYRLLLCFFFIKSVIPGESRAQVDHKAWNGKCGTRGCSLSLSLSHTRTNEHTHTVCTHTYTDAHTSLHKHTQTHTHIK